MKKRHRLLIILGSLRSHEKVTMSCKFQFVIFSQIKALANQPSKLKNLYTHYTSI